MRTVQYSFLAAGHSKIAKNVHGKFFVKKNETKLLRCESSKSLFIEWDLRKV